ncbi:MAG TPA: hypothetical protein VN461_21590 [Vicinamibacteria bacterium]|nr:hypothetical protein [Vicinamibacteria bacterium]
MSRRGRRWRRWTLFLLIQAAATLLLCELAVRLITTTNPDNGMAMIGRYPLLPYRPAPEAVRAWLQRPPGGYVVADSELGWTVAPGGRTPDGLYQANAEGARAPADRSYGERSLPGRLRLVTVGDSFTHGDGVGLEDTWQRELERRRADLEVVNLGVPGYGTDQAYLRWRRDGARLNPHFALLGIWPEDICRNLNVVRFFLQPAGGFGFLSKPRFIRADDRLQTLNLPVLEGEPLVRALIDPLNSPLLRHDYWAIPNDLELHSWQHLRVARAFATVANLYRRRELRQRLYAGTDPAGIEVTVAIAEAFARDVRRKGAVPVVVLIPMLDLLQRYAEENSLPLAQALRARKLDVIDLGPPMARLVHERGPSSCFAADSHLSPEGNRWLAGWLLDRLAPWLDAARGQPGG